jgi:hypothetical protein
MGFGLETGFNEHLQIVTTSNYSAIANPHTLQFTTARNKLSPSAVFSPVVIRWRVPTMSSASVLTFLPTGDCPTANSFRVRVKSYITLAVCRRSICLSAKPLENHDHRFFQLNPRGYSTYVTSSLTRKWGWLLWICLAFVKCMYRTYSMLLKILPFALHTSPMSVQALQSRSCISYVSYATPAA